MELLHSNITSLVLKGFYTVANALPFGLDKSFYCNALSVELRLSGLKTDVDHHQAINYKDTLIGQLTLNMVVNDAVIIQVISQHEAIATTQVELMKNYLKLTNFEVLLLLNFGIEADHKRVFLSNDYKNR